MADLETLFSHLQLACIQTYVIMLSLTLELMQDSAACSKFGCILE